LQALVTLNDPVFIEAAQALSRKIVFEGGSSEDDRLRYAYRRLLSREPTAKEKERLGQLIQQAGEEFGSDLKRATQMASDPLGPLPEGGNPKEFATWTVVSNVLLNLDEFLMRR
jgi:hypothetical protein